MKMLIIFAFCTLLNVVLATIKSVMTIKGTKISAAVWNALSFGLYSYIVIMTANADLTTLEKIIVTVVCNLIGVYGVKWVEEKMRKDKLWLVKTTISAEHFPNVKNDFEKQNIPFTYYDVKKYFVFDTFCDSQKQTRQVFEICKKYNGKIFAAEDKLDLKI